MRAVCTGAAGTSEASAGAGKRRYFSSVFATGMMDATCQPLAS